MLDWFKRIAAPLPREQLMQRLVGPVEANGRAPDGLAKDRPETPGAVIELVSGGVELASAVPGLTREFPEAPVAIHEFAGEFAPSPAAGDASAVVSAAPVGDDGPGGRDREAAAETASNDAEAAGAGDEFPAGAGVGNDAVAGEIDGATVADDSGRHEDRDDNDAAGDAAAAVAVVDDPSEPVGEVSAGADGAARAAADAFVAGRGPVRGSAGGSVTALAPAGRFADTRIIVVASQKGGSGKTTIAAHLAVRAGAAGHGPAVLIDTDPQGSLTEWWRARNDPELALASVRLDDPAADLAALRGRGAAFAIIDTPPALTASIEQVIALADLVLIPARPSPHDLRAVGATVDMVRRAGKDFLFVINGAAPRANITAECAAALSEHGPVAPVILFQRTDYAASMIDGRTVIETAAAGRSALEIAGLWKHVYARTSMRAAA